MAYVQEFIRHIGPEVNVISVCQPTVPVLAAISLLASNGEFTPRTMTMMAARSTRAQPDRGEQPGDEQEPQLVRESNVIYRVPVNYPRRGRRVYPASCSTAASWR